MLPYDDDDKEDRREKLPAAVVLSDYREMGEGRRSRPDGIGGQRQRVTRMTVARSTPACSDKSDQNPFAQWDTNP